MAESFVEVTAGSGTKLHSNTRTVGASTVHDEVVLHGEQDMATYIIATPFNATTSTATANSHLLQIMAGASLKLRIRRIEVFQTGLATTAAFMDLRIFRLTTAGTGGTVIGGAGLDPSDGAAGLAGMILPTVKGTEGTGVAAGMPYMVQTAGASSQFSQPIWVWDFDRHRSKALVIAAGTTNGIAIKNITAVAAGSVGINVWVDEASY